MPSVCPRYALGMPSFNNSVFFSDCILWKYFFCAALDMITTLPLCLTFTQINKTRCKLVISCFERLCYYLLFQTDFHFKVNKNLCACLNMHCKGTVVQNIEKTNSNNLILFVVWTQFLQQNFCLYFTKGKNRRNYYHGIIW